VSWPGTDIYFSDNVLGRKTLSPPVGYFPLSAKMILTMRTVFSRNAMERYGVKSKQKRCCRSENPKNSEKNLFFFLEFRGMPRHPGKNSIATDRQGKCVMARDGYLFFRERPRTKNFVPPSGLLSFISEDDFFQKTNFFHECHGTIWS